MEGLQPVKESVEQIIKLVVQNAKREEREESVVDVVLNRVFVGNPGTGKTTGCTLTECIYIQAVEGKRTSLCLQLRSNGLHQKLCPEFVMLVSRFSIVPVSISCCLKWRTSSRKTCPPSPRLHIIRKSSNWPSSIGQYLCVFLLCGPPDGPCRSWHAK